MKTIYKSILLLCTTTLLGSTTKAQSIDYCGLLNAMKNMSHADSVAYLHNRHLLDVYTKNYIHNHQNKSLDDSVYIIPIVFHILHDYGTEDISDAQVLNQVNILNRDYRKQNADTTQIMNGFDSIAADVHIEFRLAKKDPLGNCTNGIDRIATKLTYSGGDYAKLNQWPPNDYLNVWVVKDMGPQNAGAAGYAYYPSAVTGANAWKDGVMILETYLGSIGTSTPYTSRDLTHEVGHFLNLEHPWGNTNAPGVACGDDGVYDTPVTKGFTSCTTNNAICNPPIPENVNNYMDYAYCGKMFTNGQSQRMRAALTSSVANRSHLISAQNAAFTGINNVTLSPCAPKADFTSNYKYICSGGSVNFTDKSWNGTVSSRSWLFNGGTPATSTSANVNVTFSTPGWHAVTLTVSNVEGSDTKTENKYIYVNSNTSYFQAPFSESFEDATQFDTKWEKHNPYDNSTQWERTTNAAASGSACVYVNAYNNHPGIYNELVSPKIDISSMSGTIYLHFKYACATKSPIASNINEQLLVYYSKDCGETWYPNNNPILTLGGSTLANAGSFSTPYTSPKPSDWSEETVPLPTSPANAIMLKFVYLSGFYSNNIFLDDINIDTNPLSVQSIKNVLTAVNVYPNPTNNKANIAFYLSKQSDVAIQLIDFSGRVVRDMNYDNLGTGDVHLTIDCSNLSAGIYVVKLSTNRNIAFKKLVIK